MTAATPLPLKVLPVGVRKATLNDCVTSRLGDDDAGHDLEVAEIGLVLGPGRPQFETVTGMSSRNSKPVERQVELEEACVLVAVPAEVVGVAVGRDAEPVEHAVERVEPALPRRASPPDGGLTQASSQPLP